MPTRTLLAAALALAVVVPATAHQPPKDGHDRTVELKADATGVSVKYQLDLDLGTLAKDFQAAGEPLPTRPADAAAAYLRLRTPDIAGGLEATFNDRPLYLRLVKSEQVPTEGHLRFEWHFRGEWALSAGHPVFRFRDETFADPKEPGRIDLTLEADDTLRLKPPPGSERIVRPRKQTKDKSPFELAPGDRTELRTAAAALELVHANAPEAAPEPEPTPEVPPAQEPTVTRAEDHWALTSLLDSRRGLPLMLLLAAAFGAFHALTPGHGKTMVAAYLVGERGTVWHALLLGVVTTLTHTGAVLVVAFLLPVFFPGTPSAQVQTLLGFVGGLLVVGLGLWLLLTRLTGRADHVHLPGTGHHHHGPGGHHHHHHHDAPAGPGWLPVIVLGISGGLIPCWDAIALLLFSAASGQMALALPLLLAFSAGLAAVLVALGLVVVWARRRGVERFGESRWVKALPLVSAALLIGMGLWLCREAVHGGG